MTLDDSDAAYTHRDAVASYELIDNLVPEVAERVDIDSSDLNGVAEGVDVETYGIEVLYNQAVDAATEFGEEHDILRGGDPERSVALGVGAAVRIVAEEHGFGDLQYSDFIDASEIKGPAVQYFRRGFEEGDEVRFELGYEFDSQLLEEPKDPVENRNEQPQDTDVDASISDSGAVQDATTGEAEDSDYPNSDNSHLPANPPEYREDRFGEVIARIANETGEDYQSLEIILDLASEDPELLSNDKGDRSLFNYMVEKYDDLLRDIGVLEAEDSEVTGGSEDVDQSQSWEDVQVPDIGSEAEAPPGVAENLITAGAMGRNIAEALEEVLNPDMDLGDLEGVYRLASQSRLGQNKAAEAVITAETEGVDALDYEGKEALAEMVQAYGKFLNDKGMSMKVKDLGTAINAVDRFEESEYSSPSDLGLDSFDGDPSVSNEILRNQAITEGTTLGDVVDKVRESNLDRGNGADTALRIGGGTSGQAIAEDRDIAEEKDEETSDDFSGLDEFAS